MASSTGAAVNAVQREIKEINAATKKVEREITETEAAIEKAESDIKKAQAGIKKAQADIKKVKADIKKAQADIKKVEADIKKVEVDLSKVDAQLLSPSLSADEKDVLRTKEQQLRTKEQQLRTEEQQLRTWEQDLRTEEQDLRTWEQDLRTEVRQLRTEEQQLRTEKQQLRTEEQQLRTEEQQLRTKELQLLTEELQLLTEELQLMEQQLRKKEKLTGPELYLKRARIMDAPAQTSLKREQLDPTGPLINNGRPMMDSAAWQLPELIHPVFAKAVEFMADGTKVDEATIKTAAQLCCIGADIYMDEADLTKAVEGLLRSYLEDRKAETIMAGFADNKVSPDWALGDFLVDPSNLFLIVEATPGIGGSGDLHFQGANYFLHFWRKRTESNVFRNTCCPAFLLEVVGPHVRLSAVAWLDRVTIFPLTPLLNLLPAHPVTDRLLMPVACMLAALRMGVRELAAAHSVAACAVGPQTARAALQQPAAANKELPLPWPIGMNPRYNAATAIQLAPRNPTYYVRLAGSSGSEDSGVGGGGGVEAVVVKLYRKYGLAAHQAWADLGLAPQVLHVEQLPGGWHLVEMEWLPWPEWRRLSNLSPWQLGEALGAVEKALEFAHSATGMVHGDVRPPNCLVRCDTKEAGSWQVRFVDFEWAGREGEATYPGCLNPDIPWPEGVSYGKQLQRAHDIQLLAATTAGHAERYGHGAAGPGVVRSFHTAARDRCTMPLRGVASVMLQRGMCVGWRQRAATGLLRVVAGMGLGL